MHMNESVISKSTCLLSNNGEKKSSGVNLFSGPISLQFSGGCIDSEDFFAHGSKALWSI